MLCTVHPCLFFHLTTFLSFCYYEVSGLVRTLVFMTAFRQSREEAVRCMPFVKQMCLFLGYIRIISVRKSYMCHESTSISDGAFPIRHVSRIRDVTDPTRCFFHAQHGSLSRLFFYPRHSTGCLHSVLFFRTEVFRSSETSNRSADHPIL